jgi:hypothetical protein
LFSLSLSFFLSLHVDVRRLGTTCVVTLMVAVVLGGGSFLDYISGGCEISVMVAIDFTASNGYICTPIPAVKACSKASLVPVSCTLLFVQLAQRP